MLERTPIAAGHTLYRTTSGRLCAVARPSMATAAVAVAVIVAGELVSHLVMRRIPVLRRLGRSRRSAAALAICSALTAGLGARLVRVGPYVRLDHHWLPVRHIVSYHPHTDAHPIDRRRGGVVQLQSGRRVLVEGEPAVLTAFFGAIGVAGRGTVRGIS